MWPQLCILFLGIWLTLAPVILDPSGTPSVVKLHDYTVGFSIITLAIGNCVYRNRYFSVIFTGISLWLFIYGYFFHEHPRPGFAQSHILLGLLIIMFAVIPPDDKVS